MDFGRWLDRVFTRTRVLCFDNFDLRRWLTLAAATWLAWLGSASSNVQSRLPMPDLGWDFPKDGLTASVFLTVASVGLVVGILTWLILTWLRSRGQVMLVDLVARDHGQLVVAWNSADTLASDLFRTRLLLDGGAMLLLVLASGIGIGTSVALSPGDPLSVGSGAPIAASFLVSFVVGLSWATVTFLLDELVLPIAWATNVPLREAAVRLRSMLQARLPEILGFLAFRFVATLVVAVFIFVFGCVTCLVAWIPFVLAVIIMPLRVFLQTLSLAFLHELDPETYEAYAPLPPRG